MKYAVLAGRVMHNVWSVSDPMALEIGKAMFMKNITMRLAAVDAVRVL